MSDLHPLYVLCVHGEGRAANALGEHGIAAWAPVYEKICRAPRGRVRVIKAPLLPGYVFARLGPEDFAKAGAQERVHGVLSRDGVPAAVPEEEWIKVLLMAMSGRFDECAPSTKARPRGERRRAIQKLQDFCDALKASQLQIGANRDTQGSGGKSVSEGNDPSRRRTSRVRKAKGHRIRKVRSVA